jgi:hypothetical protein
MKKHLYFFVLILLVLTGLSVCTKDEPPSIAEEPDAKTTKGVDSTAVPTLTAAIFPPSISCTGVIISFNIKNNVGALVGQSGVCWATTACPTTANNIVRTAGVNGGGYSYTITDGVNGSLCYTQGRNGSFQSDIDQLQPATLYHIRAYFFTISGTYYSEDISFTTNPKPTITTTDVTEITATTAKVGGKITSTGNSFVVERGICYSMTLTPVAYEDNPYIEQEVQSHGGTGEFTITLTNLTPGTLYYVRSFVGVMAGIEYGDQLFEYGNEVHFTTKSAPK